MEAREKEYLDGLFEKARKAQIEMESFSQEQTDKLVKAIGKAIYDNREILSREAIEETGLGVYEGKVAKHAAITMSHWEYLKDKKSVGLIEEDKANGIYTFGKAVGIVACLTPTTNPTTTAIGNSMCAVKARNAVIISPHPRAKKCTAHCVALMNEAIIANGGPANLIQSIEEPNLDLTNQLMKDADVIVATGGAAMVKSAYSSGRPSYGVGQGNVQIVIDREFSDYDKMLSNVMTSRIYDNGMPCTGEQSLIMPKEKEDEIIGMFLDRGGVYLVTDEDDIEKLRKAIFPKGFDGPINVGIVGHTAAEVAAYAGVNVPPATRLLMVKLDKFGRDEVLCREIMCPIIRCFGYDKFEEGIELAKTNLMLEGAGHSSGIYSDNDEHIMYAGEHLPVGRVMVAQPNSTAAGSSFFNGLVPTISLGCGSWGNNAISENLTYKHLMNTTRVSYVIKDAYNPTPEEVWG